MPRDLFHLVLPLVLSQQTSSRRRSRCRSVSPGLAEVDILD